MNVVKPHVSLNVSNVEASVAFYEKIFGVPASKRRPRYAKFDLTTPSLNLTMQEAPRTGVNEGASEARRPEGPATRGSRTHTNVSHFGIQVVSSEDVAAA